MSTSSHAVAPPAKAAAPPVQRKAEPRSETQEAPQRLLTSLSSVPAVQRKCAACAGEENEDQMPVQPRLEVGPVDDPYEREADSIAGKVMAMREPGHVSAAGSAVQRACTTCSEKPEEVQRAPAEMPDLTEDDEQTPRMRVSPGGGGEHIATSSSRLTSGGSALSEQTRSFYETRMGRDLSDVRVHRGTEADTLNQSIAARAFTFQNHIWLNGSEPDTPSFTMAHELAHVMQQTSPGPIGPTSDAVMARRINRDPGEIVRRKSNPFWLPAQFTLPGASNPRSPLAVNSAKHDAAATALAKANSKGNKKVLTEVMIPNATSGGTGCGICGFADLYVSDNNKVPGIELDCDRPADKTVPKTDPNTVTSLRKFNTKSSSSCTKHLAGRRQVYSHSRAPTIVSGNMVGPFPAITGIQIADMKPGHNESARKDGVKQINNYFKGLDLVRSKAKANAGGQNIWKYGNPKLMPKTGLPKIPDKWNPNKKGGDWPVNNLRLHIGPANDYSPGGVKGRWCIAPDNVNSGIWTYFLAPDPVTLAAALKTPASPPANFKSANAKIKKIIGCLKATPKQKKAACKRPLHTQQAKLQSTAKSRKAAVVRRKPLPSKDHFDLKAWNTLRKGKGKSATTGSLKGQLDKDFPNKIRDKISFQGRAIESIDWMKASLGVERIKPKGSKVLLENKTVLEQAMFWSGDTPAGDVALTFGILRDRMGGLYVKVAKAYEKIRKKIKSAFKSTKFKTGSGSSLGKAAAKILGRIFVQLGKIVLSKTTTVIANCIESGFSKFIEEKVTGGLEQLTEEVAKVKLYIDKLTEDIVKKIESKFEEFVTGYEKTMADLASSAKMVTKIVGTISEIVKIARMVFCASGLAAAGWGAIVTCLLSIADWIAGKFDKSPLDWVIKKVMNSCRGRRLFAQALFSFDKIKTLPEQLAKGILTPIKAELPLEAKDIICDLNSLKMDKLSMADFSCTAGSSEQGDVGGEKQSSVNDETGDKAGDKTANKEGASSAPAIDGVAGQGQKHKSNAKTTTLEKTVKNGDPGVGQVIIEKGLDPKGTYKNTKVDDVTITVNVGGHIFRKVIVDVVVVNLSTSDAGKLRAICYIKADKKLTFRNDYPDKSWYEWSPLLGASHQFAATFRGSP